MPDNDDDTRNICYPEIRREDKHRRTGGKRINKRQKENKKKGARNRFQRSIRVSFWFFSFLLLFTFTKGLASARARVGDFNFGHECLPKTTDAVTPEGNRSVFDTAGMDMRVGGSGKRKKKAPATLLATPRTGLDYPPPKGAAVYNICSRATCVCQA